MLICREAQAIFGARSLLLKLATPSETPRISLEIRREARALLRFYPPAQRFKGVVIRAVELLQGEEEAWSEEELTG